MTNDISERAERKASIKPFAFCCAEGGGDPMHCDCVNKSHGVAVFEAVCSIPNCRRRAPATEAFGTYIDS